MYHLHNPLLGLIGSTLGIHTRYRHGILRSDDAHFLNLLIELLIGDQVGSLGITEIGLFLEQAVGELVYRSLGEILLKSLLLYSLTLLRRGTR